MIPKVAEAQDWLTPGNVIVVAEHLLNTWALDVTLLELRDDTIGALTRSSGVEFQWSNNVAGSCELHGSYRSSPPTIRVQRSATTARANFTAAHELGHHIQAHDFDWALGVLAPLRIAHAWIARQLEERVSDQVAVRILMPEEAVDVLWPGTLTPEFVRDLTNYGRVSGWAASIRAIGKAAPTTPVAVITVSTADGTVASAVASPNSTLFPPARGSHQSDLEGLFNLDPGRKTATEGFQYSTGRARSDLNYEWCFDESRSTMFCVTTPVYQFGDQQWNEDELTCDRCEAVFQRGEDVRCNSCRKRRCIECGSCGCEKVRGGHCIVCTMEMSLAESSRGDVCDNCR